MKLEGAFLREGIAREGKSVSAFDCFHADGGDIGRIGFRKAQDCDLAEDFVVDLGDEVVLIAGVLTPDLSELDRLDCQSFPPGMG